MTATVELENGERVQLMFRVPSRIVKVLGDLADDLDTTRNHLLRSIVIAAMLKLETVQPPPSTLGQVESAIIKKN